MKTLLQMEMYYVEREYTPTSGVDPEFKVRGAYLKKLRRAEGGAKIFGVFRVKNHDFTPENHIFSNCRGRREIFWGIPSEKSRFYAKNPYFFQFFLGGGGARRVRAPLDPPLLCTFIIIKDILTIIRI